jgi:hypothetical protein
MAHSELLHELFVFTNAIIKRIFCQYQKANCENYIFYSLIHLVNLKDEVMVCLLRKLNSYLIYFFLKYCMKGRDLKITTSNS